MVIHDTECTYWDQVSLNNTNPNPTGVRPQNLSYHEQMVPSSFQSLGKYVSGIRFTKQFRMLFPVYRYKKMPLKWSVQHTLGTYNVT